MLYFKHGTIEDELKQLVLEQNPKVAEFGITAENIKIVKYVDYGAGIRNVEIAADGARGTVKVSIVLDFNWGTFGASEFVWKITPTLPGYKAKASEILKVVADGLGATIDPSTFLADPDAEVVIPQSAAMVNLVTKTNLLMPYDTDVNIFAIRQKELDLGKILNGVDTSPIYFDVTKPEGEYVKLANTVSTPLNFTKAKYIVPSVYPEFAFWGLDADGSLYSYAIDDRPVSDESLASLNNSLVNLGYVPLDKTFAAPSPQRWTDPVYAIGNTAYGKFVGYGDGNYWPKPGTDELVESLAHTQTWDYPIDGLFKILGKPATVINILPRK